MATKLAGQSGPDVVQFGRVGSREGSPIVPAEVMHVEDGALAGSGRGVQHGLQPGHVGGRERAEGRALDALPAERDAYELQTLASEVGRTCGIRRVDVVDALGPGLGLAKLRARHVDPVILGSRDRRRRGRAGRSGRGRGCGCGCACERGCRARGRRGGGDTRRGRGRRGRWAGVGTGTGELGHIAAQVGQHEGDHERPAEGRLAEHERPLDGVRGNGDARRHCLREAVELHAAIRHGGEAHAGQAIAAANRRIWVDPHQQLGRLGADCLEYLDRHPGRRRTSLGSG